MNYATNHLEQVILRVDFEPIAALITQARPELSNRLAATHPTFAMIPVTQLNFQFGAVAGMNQQVIANNFQHRSEDGSSTIVFSHNFFSLEYVRYLNGTQLLGDLATFVEHLTQLHGNAAVTRVGLRYVNNIKLENGAAQDWDTLIAQPLIDSVKASLEPGVRVARSIHQAETFNDDVRLIFHYGFLNPDYPAEMVRREFLLDLDAVHVGQTQLANVHQCCAQLNAACEAKFEASIADGLRQLMGVQP
jgi:uncharacterized protein (TIGR04255 family)